jgi:hypothetical protein
MLQERPLPVVGRRALLLAPAALALAPARPGSARIQVGMAELLVRGEVVLPDDGAPLAWRLVQDVAEAAPAAGFERRALGFAVATDPFAPLLLTDEATGSACRLLPGEAAFVREGTVQRRESLGPDAVGYLRIGLVSAGAAGDAGGDRLRFAGPTFAAPTGVSALALLRIPLEAGTRSVLPAGAGAALLVVEQGEVDLEAAGGRETLTTTVGSDTAYAVRSVVGPATITGRRGATSLLAAVFA